MFAHRTNVRFLSLANNPTLCLGFGFRVPVLLAETLVELHVPRCNLPGLPDGLGQLTKLEMLTANHNAIRELPAELYTLTRLHTLFLHGNRLAKVDKDICKLTRLTGTHDFESARRGTTWKGHHGRLFLHENSLLTEPPVECVKEDIDGRSKGCFVTVCTWFSSQKRKPPKSARKLG